MDFCMKLLQSRYQLLGRPAQKGHQFVGWDCFNLGEEKQSPFVWLQAQKRLMDGCPGTLQGRDRPYAAGGSLGKGVGIGICKIDPEIPQLS